MKLSPEAPWFDTVDRQIRLRHSSVVVFTACDFDATGVEPRRFRAYVPRIKILILVPTTVRKGSSVLFCHIHCVCILYWPIYMYFLHARRNTRQFCTVSGNWRFFIQSTPCPQNYVFNIWRRVASYMTTRLRRNLLSPFSIHKYMAGKFILNIESHKAVLMCWCTIRLLLR